MDKLSASPLWDLFKHVRSWLVNLDRASEERKQQSIRALRSVISASRETAVYIRKLKDTNQRDHAVEAHLSVLWTELGFSLEDLGINKLAKRCQIKGKQWSKPDHYDDALHADDCNGHNIQRSTGSCPLTPLSKQRIERNIHINFSGRSAFQHLYRHRGCAGVLWG